MNLRAPISSIMTRRLITVGPKDSLLLVKGLFDTHRIHHIPVVEQKRIVGIISKYDLANYAKGSNCEDDFMLGKWLEMSTAEDIMTKGLAKLGPDDHIDVALELFLENLFHALPIVEDDELVGIVTTHDLMRLMLRHSTQPA